MLGDFLDHAPKPEEFIETISEKAKELLKTGHLYWVTDEMNKLQYLIIYDHPESVWNRNMINHWKYFCPVKTVPALQWEKCEPDKLRKYVDYIGYFSESKTWIIGRLSEDQEYFVSNDGAKWDVLDIDYIFELHKVIPFMPFPPQPVQQESVSHKRIRIEIGGQVTEHIIFPSKEDPDLFLIDPPF